ncbi:MAG: SUMF1/EgtB/PvdO family nonheme iron enzyme [Desulfobacteraceae bacterium]|nr:SUMF1/EgtB/PvdO family nonheme iron enzyme [Desulfobacteraceae bacterium]
MNSSNQLTVLHLSDLHIKKNEKQKTDRGMVLDPLLRRLERDYQTGLRPELVFVTGDIAYSGVKQEYDLAGPFFKKKLLEAVHLDATRLYIVPGNHDVNRDVYRPKDIPQYDSNQEINDELSDSGYRKDLFKGMAAYFKFIRKHFPHLTSEAGDLVPFVDRFKSQTGMHVGLVGLNSAWMCRKRKDDEKDNGMIAIGEYQIKTALQELETKGEVDITFALFHHPLGWLAPMDRRICERKLNRTIALAGHLHEPGGGFFHGFSGEMVHIQAGGAYLGSGSTWPSRYHYISIDTQAANLCASFRSFSGDISGGSHEWNVDTETGGDDGTKIIPVNFLKGEQITEPSIPAPEMPEFPEPYAAWIAQNYSYMEAEKLAPRSLVRPLSLPDIFVHLCAGDPIKKELSPEDQTKRKDARSLKEGNEKSPEIESLVAKHQYLLIEGQPGSGKSTMLKHLAYILSPETAIKPKYQGLDGYLPVLIQLKELQAYCHSDMTTENRVCPVGEQMLDWYLTKKLSGRLDRDLINRFVACGRALFLIDGLDEIDSNLREQAVNALADVAIEHKENKVILAGRPHGLEGVATNRFGKFRTTVEELSPEQIECFIQQWFDYFYPGTDNQGKKGADDLLGEMSDHPAIDQLTSNPLMLTAICLLYMDDKELPDQRAELFKKFIDNMLWRRFKDDPEQVHDCLKQLANDMHTKRVRMVDKSFAVESISKVIKPKPDEEPAVFSKRVKKKFEHIEANCGLLVSKNGEYGFWHLAFQEFLTSQHLMDNYGASYEAIEPYWQEDWYKEVIELYISYLSNDHKAPANNIVKKAVETKDAPPYKRWRLAGHALKDFHHNRRISEIENRVKKNLLQIIERPLEPGILLDAGEILGRLGEIRELDTFETIAQGEYDLENIGVRTISEFEIAKYPVANQWFLQFVKEGGYKNLDLWTHYGKIWQEKRKAKQPATWIKRIYRCPNQPVTGISWYEATAFCNWMTKKQDGYSYFLPSQNQWQAAAAGKDKRKYPWGPEWKQGIFNTKESKIGRPSPVGIFIEGKTPEPHIFDMAGNVWEWTSTNHKTSETAKDYLYDEDFEKQLEHGLPIIKGGAWYNSADRAACVDRNYYNPYYRYDNVGFRCARKRA